MARVVLAMSGGVDSSVAAHLLLEQGHEVIGVFMRHGEESPVAARSSSDAASPHQLPVVHPPADHRQGCCTASDAEDARRVADRLGIPFYALNLRAEFRQIIEYFTDEYASGRTPNPCVMCNNWIKFGKLFDYANSVGAEYVATGHYARLLPNADAEVPRLCRGIDAQKDQSYVLFGINRDYLSRMLLPVGHHHKPQIRLLAKGLGLRVADKRDSQEICFVTSGKHAEFIRAWRGTTTPGEIVTTAGAVVGRHQGIERFTIGQRKGLGVATGSPQYVVRIEPDSHRVVIGSHQELGRTELSADRTNWLTSCPSSPFRCQAQIRYNSRPAEATARILPPNRLRVTFDKPQHGVAPGQSVVCFDGDRVLGGGWIE